MKRLMLAACLAASLSGATGAAHVGASESAVPVTDASVLNGLSPFNWVCKTNYVSTTVCGASVTLGFKGTGRVELLVDAEHIGKATACATRYPIIAWSVNGGPCQSHQLKAGETRVPLVSDASDPVVDLYVKGMSPFENRYQGDAPGTALKIVGFAVDAGGAATACSLPDKVWLNIGDSIMSGDGAAYAKGRGRPPNDLWAESDDGRAGYGYLLARHFGYREARIAYGGYNWAGGMAGVPATATLIDQKTSTVGRLEGGRLNPAPDVVLINLGENGVPADAVVVEALGRLRSRVKPDTVVVLMIPLSGRGRTELTRAFNAYTASAPDAHAHLVDLGPLPLETCDGQHPTAEGHSAVFRAALPAFEGILNRAPARR
jgi:hypothetical protein